jgi:hypothetical protein
MGVIWKKSKKNLVCECEISGVCRAATHRYTVDCQRFMRRMQTLGPLGHGYLR